MVPSPVVLVDIVTRWGTMVVGPILSSEVRNHGLLIDPQEPAVWHRNAVNPARERNKGEWRHRMYSRKA